MSEQSLQAALNDRGSVEELWRGIAEGESLCAICRDENMPPRKMVAKWIYKDIEGFGSQYARARDAGLDLMADDLVGISDEQCEATRADGSTYDPEVNRDKLRVEARKWYLSKLAPKRYGDRLDLNHGGQVSVAEALREARKRAGGG